ncbi:hypothetical protein AB0O51_11690 [Streptomyces sp. NPDC090301]|uniref:hypothetical protein n=1 Tax=Streptomyces sp. NPDC090301 TaxID=3154975 RepID=UPI003415B8EB
MHVHLTHSGLASAAGATLIALAAAVMVGSAPVAQAQEIPLGLGHRLVEHYERAPATARPLPGKGTARHPYLTLNVLLRTDGCMRRPGLRLCFFLELSP